jgi:hypothetical protein
MTSSDDAAMRAAGFSVCILHPSCDAVCGGCDRKARAAIAAYRAHLEATGRTISEPDDGGADDRYDADLRWARDND